MNPYICTNECSGHGVCSNVTKLCECDPFWIESPFGPSNCAWSVVYVVLFVLISTVLIVGSLYLFRNVRLKKASKSKKWKKRKNQLNYSHLGSGSIHRFFFSKMILSKNVYFYLHYDSPWLVDDSNSDAEYAEFHRARRKRRNRKNRSNQQSDRVDLLNNSRSESSGSETLFDKSIISENALWISRPTISKDDFLVFSISIKSNLEGLWR